MRKKNRKMKQSLRNNRRFVAGITVFRIGLLLLTAFGLSACSGTLTTEIAESYPDGSSKVERTYKDQDGKRILVKEVLYYPNHQKYMEGEYRNNKRHGLWISWYQNGNVWSKGEFDEGVEEGIRVVYHENGQKYYEGKFKNGKKSGIWKFWDEKGRPVREVDFDE